MAIGASVLYCPQAGNRHTKKRVVLPAWAIDALQRINAIVAG